MAHVYVIDALVLYLITWGHKQENLDLSEP